MTHARSHALTTSKFNSVLQAPENRERLLELVHGEVVEKVLTEEHGKLAALIVHFVYSTA